MVYYYIIFLKSYHKGYPMEKFKNILMNIISFLKNNKIIQLIINDIINEYNTCKNLSSRFKEEENLKKEKEKQDRKDKFHRDVKQDIINCFRSGKISSITIDSLIVDDFSKLPHDALDRDIKINKKYIPLFNKGVRDYIISNFIKDGENLVYRASSNDYIRVDATLHAKERLVTRFLSVYVSNKSEDNRVFNYLKEDFYPNIKDYIDEHYGDGVNDAHAFIRKLCIEQSDYLDSVIRKLMSDASYNKNPNNKIKERCDKRNNRQITYYDTMFMYVYDLKDSKIITIELYSSPKKGGFKQNYSRMVNSRIDDITPSVIDHVYKERNDRVLRPIGDFVSSEK